MWAMFHCILIEEFKIRNDATSEYVIMSVKINHAWLNICLSYYSPCYAYGVFSHDVKAAMLVGWISRLGI